MHNPWKRDSRLLLGAFVAVALSHWVMLQAPVRLATSPASLSKNEPFEIWSEKKDRDLESKDRNIVTTMRAPENESLKDRSAKFLGEFDNRVEEETRAAIRGKFRAAPPDTAPGDEGMAQFMPFGSAPDDLPDSLKKGRESVLNTDRVVHAAFINRIGEEIYDGWHGHLLRALERMAIAKKELRDDVYITRILVTLNEIGEVVAIQLVKKSGVEPIDSAPGKAFWEAARFPNPPSQLIGQDGFVRQEFDFILHLNKSAFLLVPVWA